MYKVFDTLEEYNQFTNDGANLTAGVIYYIKEDGSTHFQTNNINGEEKVYDMIDGIPEGYVKPTGNISITENGENINVNEYATASVNVPIPEGYIVPSGNKEITQNGTNIDVAQYATASVNVVPNLTTQNITENGTYQPSGNYDGFSSVTVNVAGSGGDDVLRDLIERDITTLNIPDGTTKIGTYAFRNCSGLISVTIPNSVTEIGTNAFNNCSALTSVSIPNGITSIGSNALSECGLTSVTIPNSVTSINDYAFSNCDKLTSVIVPNYIPYVQTTAFYGCSSLPVENYVQYVGTWALKYNTTQTSYTLRQDTTYLLGTFNGCKGITSVGEIGSGASVEIPNSVVAISQGCFQSCSGLTSVTIGNSVTYIGTNAFYSCTSITSITIQATTPPTLGGTSVFNNTNNSPIYVPADSVDAYKTATNWSSYADRLQPIQNS